MSVTDRVIVNIYDQARPLVLPTLSEVLVIGTTPGKAVQNQWRRYASYDEALADYDVTDPEAVLLQVFFAQPERIERINVVNIDRSDFRKATLTQGTGQSEITYTSAGYGDVAENVSVAHVNPGPNGSLSVSVSKTLTVGDPAQNNALDWTSKRKATEFVRIEYRDPGLPSQAASLEVTTNRAIEATYHDIVVHLATDATGAITTTAQDIVALVQGSPEAQEIVDVAHSSGSDGTGVVAAQARTAIPVDVTVTLETDGAGTVTSTAAEVVQLVNGTPEVAEAVSASLTGPGNVGSGPAPEFPRTNLQRGTTAEPAELSRALAAIKAYEKRQGLPETYFLLCTSHDEVPGDRLELSNAVSARMMFYLTSSKPGETPEAIHQLAVDMASDRTLILAHTESERYPEAGLCAQWAASTPGQFTTAYKEINTFSLPEYDETDIALIEGSAPGGPGGFTIEDAFGVPVTAGSWATNGTFADLRRNKDWLIVHIKAAILYELINRNIILFDPRGFAIIKAALNNVCKQATSQGIIALKSTGEPWYEIIMPRPEDVPVLNRARRDLSNPGPRIDLRWAGAIERATVEVYATA